MQAVVIPPPEQPYDTSNKAVRVVVDSAQRDRRLFPTPAQYELAFEDDLNDVVAVRLVYADLPRSPFLIGPSTDAVELDGRACAIAHGDYDAEGLAAALSAALPGVDVRHLAGRDGYAFVSAAPFALTFPRGSALSAILGFGGVERAQSSAMAGVGTHVLESPYRRNFEFLRSYAIVKVDGFDTLKGPAGPLLGAFAAVPLGGGEAARAAEREISKSFNPPLARLAKLRVSLLDRTGAPLDTQMMDHVLDLQFEIFRQRRKYRPQ